MLESRNSRLTEGSCQSRWPEEQWGGKGEGNRIIKKQQGRVGGNIHIAQACIQTERRGKEEDPIGGWGNLAHGVLWRREGKKEKADVL